MRIIICPVVERQREIDLTQRLIAAIAEELWRLYGGNEQLNWLEAEMHLMRIVGEAKAEVGVTDVFGPPVAGAVAEDLAIIEVARPLRPHREAPGQCRSVARPRAERPVRRPLAVSA